LASLLEKALRVAVVLFVSFLIVYGSRFVLRRFLLRRARTPRAKAEVSRKIDTFLPLLQNVIAYLVAFFALILILREIGVDAAALLAGAGVVGIAVGFGAQTLIRDILTGLFLVLEDSISVGDVVQIEDVTGTVEEIGLRITRIRTFSGALVTIPNGEITRITNYNRGFTRAVIEVSVAYEADVDKAVAVLESVARDYRRNHPDLILEEPTVQRIVRLENSGVVLRVVARVLPQKQWEVERDLLYCIKKAFDTEGIEIPYPKYVILLER